jgi:hypothetical protein
MIQILLVVCCVFACPLLMGGMMWFMGRDREGGKVEREIMRLNRAAEARSLAASGSSPTLDSSTERTRVAPGEGAAAPSRR